MEYLYKYRTIENIDRDLAMIANDSFFHLNKLKKSLFDSKERIKKLLLNNPYIEFHTNPLSFIISFLPCVDINVLKEKLCEKRIKIRFLSGF